MKIPTATGMFVVTALPVPGFMRAPEPVTITLAPGQHERVDLVYDTGIR